MTHKPPAIRQQTDLARLSPLELYLKEIAKYPLLSPEEELELGKKLFDKNDIDAAHRLVTANLRLVIKIANEFRRAQTQLLDLIQEGNAGLMQAVKKFNPYKGVRLTSYAVWWIRAYILKYLMDNHSQVRIGTTAAQRRLFFNLRKETEKLLREYDQVDTKLLAQKLDVKEREIIEMQQRLGAPDLSLDAPLYDDSPDSTRANTIHAIEATAEEVFAEDEIRHIFKEHLDAFRKQLKGRDLEIFDERLMSDQPLTLREVGDKYGITRERARQLESRIVHKLKAYVAEKGQLVSGRDS